MYLPYLLFLVETKQQNDYVRDIGVMLGYDDMCIVSPPWMMCGDFNEILHQSEKRGGRIKNEESFKSFRLIIQVCGMGYLKHKGNPFSWVGRRRAEVIECCLDRVMVNSEWRSAYPESETEYLDLAESDHRPIMVIEYEKQIRRGQFRYNKRLYMEDNLVDTVRRSWKED